MSDDNKIVGLETAREAQTIREIDEDQAHWEELADKLGSLMVNSPLHHSAYYSAALRALIDAVRMSGVGPEEAIGQIEKRLKILRDTIKAVT
jgi:hypothetical protein